MSKCRDFVLSYSIDDRHQTSDVRLATFGIKTKLRLAPCPMPPAPCSMLLAPSLACASFHPCVLRNPGEEKNSISCSMHYALCTMPYALFSMLLAPCSLLYVLCSPLIRNPGTNGICCKRFSGSSIVISTSVPGCVTIGKTVGYFKVVDSATLCSTSNY